MSDQKLVVNRGKASPVEEPRLPKALRHLSFTLVTSVNQRLSWGLSWGHRKTQAWFLHSASLHLQGSFLLGPMLDPTHQALASQELLPTYQQELQQMAHSTPVK